MRKLIIAFSLLLLAACSDSPIPPPSEPLQFTGPTFMLNVASISIAQDYKSPKTPPNVEHLADIPPAKAVTQWAGTKLIAAGHANSLEVDIKNASVLHKHLPKQTTGIEGMFTTEQTEEYDGTLEVEIKIYLPRSPLPVAHLNALVQQKLTLPENATLADRDRVLHQMTINLLKELEPQLDDNIRRYFGNYLM